VKAFAVERGIEVLTPESLKDPAFVERLREARPEVICVVAFRILPEAVYTIPSKGSFNLHGSLLPKYRGAAPINWAIINGDRETGVTTFFLQRSVDTGSMILQRVIPIGPEMTAGELHDVMMEVGAEAVVETLRMIGAGDILPRPQDDSEATPAPKIFRDDCRIDWTASAEHLHDFIRGLSPYPGAFTTWRGKILKILRAQVRHDSGLKPGEVVAHGETLLVGAGTGSIEIRELQLEGRRAMSVEEFLRGTTFAQGERFDAGAN
jgi:methionyl-tRNA formyltransferase